MKVPVICLSLLFILVGYSQENLQSSAASQKTAAYAKQILQKAAEACEKIKTIEYKEEQFHTKHADELPFLTATVRQERANVPEMGFLPGKFMVEGLTGNAKNPRAAFAFSYDGASFRVLEAAEKVIQVVKSPTPYIAGQVLGPTGGALVGIPQFTQDQPFKIFLETGENFTYEGTQTINGEECDIISVTRTFEHPALGKQSSTIRWFIGRSDSLPRGNDTGDTQRKIKILKINGAGSATDYFIPIENGYSERVVTGKESRGKGLLAVGTSAPDWTLLDSQGKSHSLSEYRGKVVLMDFWGTWCVPCWKTMPFIQSLHEKFKDRGVEVFGISIIDKEGDPVGFMKRKGYTYNLLLNGDNVAELYKAVTLPTLYVIGVNGEIIHAEYGYRDSAKEELISVIEEYLKKQKK
jgi:peroxiredoxin